MNEGDSQATAPSNADTAVLRLAERTWRRAGVRRSDRRELRNDLAAELSGASAAGLSSSAVLGPDPAATVRQLAQENDLSGRSLWLGRFLVAALLGSLVGWAPVLLLYSAEFSNGSGTSWDSPYLYYPVFGVLSYGLTLLVVAATLHISGDAQVRRSLTVLATVLPITAIVATGAGVSIAASQNFETRPHVFIASAIAVLAVYLAGCATARLIAIRQRPHEDRPTSVVSWELTPAT
jgi:hypothetical protein